MGFEPTTSSLGSWHSTPELRPPTAQKCLVPRASSTASLLVIAPGDDAGRGSLDLQRMRAAPIERRDLDGLTGDHVALGAEELEHELQRRAALVVIVRDQPAEARALRAGGEAGDVDFDGEQ